MGWLIAGLIIVGVIFYLFWLRPIPTESLVSKPAPVSGYAEALQRIQALHQAEMATGPCHDVCLSKLYTHGHPTPHVLVFMHGYTTCPEQFAQLAEQFFEAGYNVFIPKMPYHGYANRLTNDQQYLTAEDLTVYGDQAVDIARGLGQQVSVLGISGGGTVAAWLAQNRADVDYAIPLSALIGVGLVPTALAAPFINLLRLLPSLFVWWDPRTKDKNPYSIYYAYPRYSLRSLGQLLQLGLAVRRQARQNEPAGRQILMLTNAYDVSVNRSQLYALRDMWASHPAVNVRWYEFEKEMKMLHDIITPGTPNIPTDEVYARLVNQVLALHQEITEQP